MLSHFKENKSLTMLVSLSLLMLVYPFFELSRLGSMFYTIIFTLSLLASVYAISFDVRFMAIGTLLAIPILVCHLSNFILNSVTLEIIMRICTLVFMVYTVIALLQRVLTAKKVGLDQIYGAVGAYVLIGIIFGFIYLLVELAAPGAFVLNGSPPEVASFVYFSFVALTSTGFGDITPKLAFARSIVVIELITGVVYVAVLIGRLLGASQNQSDMDEDSDEIERRRKEQEVQDILVQAIPLKQRPIGVISVCVMMNFVTSALMFHSHLPFFLDSWGTSFAVLLGGWWAGMATAVLYNLLIAATLWGWPSWIWVFSSLWIAAATWVFKKRGWIQTVKPLQLLAAGIITGFLNGFIVQIIMHFAHTAPYEGTLPVFRFFLRTTSNAAFAALAEKMFVEIADKTFALMMACVAVYLLKDFLAGYKKKLESSKL